MNSKRINILIKAVFIVLLNSDIVPSRENLHGDLRTSWISPQSKYDFEMSQYTNGDSIHLMPERFQNLHQFQDSSSSFDIQSLYPDILLRSEIFRPADIHNTKTSKVRTTTTEVITKVEATSTTTEAVPTTTETASTTTEETTIKAKQENTTRIGTTVVQSKVTTPISTTTNTTSMLPNATSLTSIAPVSTTTHPPKTTPKINRPGPPQFSSRESVDPQLLPELMKLYASFGILPYKTKGRN